MLSVDGQHRGGGEEREVGVAVVEEEFEEGGVVFGGDF